LFVADSAAGFGYFKNFGRTRRQGFEIGAQQTIGTVLLGAHYTSLEASYQSSEILNANGNSSNNAPAPGFEGTISIRPGNRIALIPQHIAKAFAEWHAGKALDINFDALLIGDALA